MKHYWILLLTWLVVSLALNVRLGYKLRWAKKHTGPVMLALISTPQSFWFLRPDQEVFEMFFDNPPKLQTGTNLADIVYTDDNSWERHFVSAQLAQKKPAR